MAKILHFWESFERALRFNEERKLDIILRRLIQCRVQLMSNFKVRVSPSFWVVSFITHLSCLKLTIFTSCWLDVVFLFCNKGCWNLRAVVPCNSEKWPLKTLSYSYNKKLSFESLKPFSMAPVLAWVLISVLMNYQVLSNCSFSKVG